MFSGRDNVSILILYSERVKDLGTLLDGSLKSKTKVTVVVAKARTMLIFLRGTTDNFTPNMFLLHYSECKRPYPEYYANIISIL